MSRVVVALVFVSALAACKRDAACREGCTKVGVDAASEMCTMMCTADCDDLARDFGMSVDKCEAMQRGDFP